MTLPENPPSLDILNMANNRTDEEEEQEIEAREVIEEREEEEGIEQPEEEMPQQEQIRGKEMGLEIITKKSEGWPKDALSLRPL